jgi:predicted aldo/keto reductase-like oxidoreductase
MENAIKRNSAGLPVRRLGRSTEEVSIIGLGGGHLARSTVPRESAVQIVQAAVDAGVSFFDTAWEYWAGESETRIGLGLEGRRDKAFLMTKVCARDREGAEKQLHESLKRLRTDVIDLWQFHEINYDNDPEWIFAPGGAVEAAVAAREAGKIRFIGFTGHKSPHIMLSMLEQDFAWDSCQLPINVMDAHYRSFQRQVLPELNRRGIAALGMKGLGGRGQLVTDVGLSPAACRRYALTLPISTLIVGCESMENLEQDLAIAREFTPMSEVEKTELLERVRPEAGDGRHEWFKSTQFFDSPTHRAQHSFPPMEAVIKR